MEIAMKKLLESFSINGMPVKNRMVISAMGTVYFDENGMVTDRYLSYIRKRVLGGWGLIITEICRVCAEAGHIRGIPGIYNEEHIASHRKVTQCVHECGGKIAMQIYHAGWRAPSRITGCQPVSPSPIPAGDRFEMPREMTREDIRRTVEDLPMPPSMRKRQGMMVWNYTAGMAFCLVRSSPDRVTSVLTNTAGLLKTALVSCWKSSDGHVKRLGGIFRFGANFPCMNMWKAGLN